MIHIHVAGERHHCCAGPSVTRTPGETKRQRLEDGLEIAEGTWAELKQIAEEFGVEMAVPKN